MGTPPPVGGLPPRWTGPPLRSVALSAAGGVTTDPPLGRCPCREPPQTLSLLLANRHGRFEIADFHYENQSRSQAPRRLFAEARASPTAHVYVEHLRSRRPGPACRRFVQALAALKRLVNGYSPIALDPSTPLSTLTILLATNSHSSPPLGLPALRTQSPSPPIRVHYECL